MQWPGQRASLFGVHEGNSCHNNKAEAGIIDTLNYYCIFFFPDSVL